MGAAERGVRCGRWGRKGTAERRGDDGRWCRGNEAKREETPQLQMMRMKMMRQAQQLPGPGTFLWEGGALEVGQARSLSYVTTLTLR